MDPFSCDTKGFHHFLLGSGLDTLTFFCQISVVKAKGFNRHLGSLLTIQHFNVDTNVFDWMFAGNGFSDDIGNSLTR